VSRLIDVTLTEYDEFAGLTEGAVGIGIAGPPMKVRRRSLQLSTRDSLSMLWWDEDPTVLYLHGGGQNAHTWDVVAMALGRSAVAVDLPGHGHSSWRPNGDYSPETSADLIAELIAQFMPSLEVVVGMSLGGLTLIHLAATHADLVPRAIMVDVTPGVTKQVSGMSSAQRGSTLLREGQPIFDSFEEMLAATAATLHHRSSERLWWGVRHNSVQLPDGRWRWRYDRVRSESVPHRDYANLWDDVERIEAPTMLIRGAASAFVSAEDIQELMRRRPSAVVEEVEGAGHSVQSDRPARLAELIESFTFV
jgi:esterase